MIFYSDFIAFKYRLQTKLWGIKKHPFRPSVCPNVLKAQLLVLLKWWIYTDQTLIVAVKELRVCIKEDTYKCCLGYPFVHWQKILVVFALKWVGRCLASHFNRYMQFRKLKPKERTLCINCGLFLLTGETERHEARGHKIKSPISKKMMKRPTELFSPLDDNKTFAVRNWFCNL